MQLDHRDKIAFEMTPAVPVPRYGALPPLDVGRVRYLTAANGMFVEARSRALHACVMIADWEGVLPFGSMQPFARLAGGPVPPALQEKFVAIARRACPNEAAALIVWRANRYELILPTELHASPGRVSYATRGIDPLDVVIDMHSHGGGSAFFSTQDNADDLANPSPCFNALVFGAVDTDRPAFAGRFVVNGWASSQVDEPAQHLATMTGGRVAQLLRAIEEQTD